MTGYRKLILKQKKLKFERAFAHGVITSNNFWTAGIEAGSRRRPNYQSSQHLLEWDIDFGFRHS